MKKIILIALFLLSWVSGGSAQVAVIANKSVPVDTITNVQLFELYSRETRQWPNGEPVIPYDLKRKGEVKDTFYKFLGKSASRMKSIWLVNMLSGEGDPPVSVESEAAMLERIANTPGAIGFLSAPVDTAGVKTLVIIPHGEK